VDIAIDGAEAQCILQQHHQIGSISGTDHHQTLPVTTPPASLIEFELPREATVGMSGLGL
jgi:hypothetical protein